MVPVILDSELQSKLNGISEPVVLVDENGRQFGVFSPASPEQRTRMWEPPMKPYEYPPFDRCKFISSEELLEGLRDK